MRWLATEILEEILCEVKAIRKLLTKPSESLGVVIEGGIMGASPIVLPAGGTYQFWVSDQVNQAYLAALPAGESLAPSFADSSDFTGAMDATTVPVPTDGSVVVPTGFLPVASGTIVTAAAPDQPGVPVNFTLDETGTSTTTTQAVPLVVPITVAAPTAPLPQESLGTLFGGPIVAIAPASLVAALAKAKTSTTPVANPAAKK